MTFNLPRAFRITPYLMVFCGHLSLILTPEIPLTHEVLMLFLIGLAGLYEGGRFRLPVWFWNTLLILILLVCAGLVYFSVRDFEAVFRAAIYFMIYVLTVRLFHKETDRDYVLIYVLSFMELCAASILTIDLRFLLSMVLFLFVATWTLIIFNLKKEVDRASSSGDEVVDPLLRTRYYRIISPRLLFTSSLASLIIFVLCVIFFFITPRLGRGFFQWRSGISPRVSGFSDTVELGSLGAIKMDHTPVMRVHLIGMDEPMMDIKWRGNALDYYDGHTWTDARGIKEQKGFTFESRNAIGFPGIYGPVIRVAEADAVKGLLEQEIYLDPIESPVLFAADQAQYFQVPAKFRYLVIYKNDYYSLSLVGAIYDRIRYLAYSRVPERSPKKIRAAWSRADMKAIRRNQDLIDFLFVPSGLERVKELAQKIVGHEKNPFDWAILIERYLDENYKYSLERSPIREKTPLEDFLFRDKRGHCEYYATALAIMLRTLGVPTRMVTGFQRGVWNPYEKYYRVRQSDAHAWVEMYTPEVGWVSFDPTPAASITYNDTLGWLSGLQEYLDSMRFKWNRYVVDLKLEDQIDAARTLQDRGADVSRQLRHLPGDLFSRFSLATGSPALLIGTGLIVFGIIFLILYAIWMRGLPGLIIAGGKVMTISQDQRTASRYFSKLVRLLKKHGLQKTDGQTAGELLENAFAKPALPREPIVKLTGIYHKARFGLQALDANDRKTAEQALRELGRIRRSRV